jgi:hypothetical protein
MQELNGELAQQVSALVVQPVENLLAERFNQPLVEPVAGRVGYQDVLAPTQPAAGSDFSYQATGAAAIWPLSIMARLTTDANVADRSFTLEYRDGQNVRYLVGGVQATLAASQRQTFCWHPLAGDVAWPVNDVAIGPLPQQMLYATHSLVLHIGNAQAGDQIDQVRLSVYVYPNDPGSGP